MNIDWCSVSVEQLVVENEHCWLMLDARALCRWRLRLLAAPTMYIYITLSSDLMPSMWGVSVIKERADGVTGNGVRLNEMEEAHTLWTKCTWKVVRINLITCSRCMWEINHLPDENRLRYMWLCVNLNLLLQISHLSPQQQGEERCCVSATPSGYMMRCNLKTDGYFFILIVSPQADEQNGEEGRQRQRLARRSVQKTDR